MKKQTNQNLEIMKAQINNRGFEKGEEIYCPFQVTKNLRIVNIATTKLHKNTITIASFETKEEARRWVALQYLLYA